MKVRPRAVLVENVPSIISLGNGTVVNEIYNALNVMGYKVRHRILFTGHLWDAIKEIDDLHQRTREEIETARRNIKPIGQRKGK